MASTPERMSLGSPANLREWWADVPGSNQRAASHRLLLDTTTINKARNNAITWSQVCVPTPIFIRGTTSLMSLK